MYDNFTGIDTAEYIDDINFSSKIHTAKISVDFTVK